MFLKQGNKLIIRKLFLIKFQGLMYGTFYERSIVNNFIMKLKIFANFILLSLIGSSAFAQDTSANQTLSKDQTYPISSSVRNYMVPKKTHIYRDTRLGSSSPYYNTYQKNDKGAGAITTNPHKTSGIAIYPGNHFDSSTNVTPHIYRDTRLGSSSPGHRTYKTNDYGAGAITTNPHK